MEQSGFTYFQLIETFSVIFTLAMNVYVTHKDTEAKQIGNQIALDARYNDIWKECYIRPELYRVLEKDLDLTSSPVTNDEHLFVRTLIFHLETTRRASTKGLLVKIEGLNRDARGFLSLPIPKAVWQKLKPLQNQDFAAFVESVLK